MSVKLINRKIIHVDMDAFYASIEQRDNNEFRGKPLAVGFAGNRGVVAAASYEARKFGVYSAMPSKTAIKKCPNIIFTPARFDVYKDVSSQIRNIFLDYTDLVEPLSLDEAYLDVTTNHKNNPSATLIAREIKDRIKKETGLTASAGVSINKFLAKIASDYKKPNGLFTINPEDAESFVKDLPVERFFGVGKVTSQKMHSLNIHTGKDLLKFSEIELVKHFGKAGHIYYMFARANDPREVEANRIIKSVGSERTFLQDITNYDDLNKALLNISDIAWERIAKKQFYGKTLTLKIKFSDFKQITRSITIQDNISDFELFSKLADELLQQITINDKGIRLVGLTISNLDNNDHLYRQLKIPFK